ncbi:hypothetical protein LCGC14_0608510 [marine sediment metagenome]|uniref:Adenine methyltransferase n=1 Tax=marine sediment metagenome TaxID=412755 RepID=A0A0F9UGU5_9ZZZZ
MGKKYKIILSDPPWTYRDKAQAGHRGVNYKYPLLTINEIKKLPVGRISADTSILFLWATAPLLREALDTLDAWGFAYKTVGFVWIKKNKKSLTNFWGMGHYTRACAEFVLIGTKGKTKDLIASHKIHQIIEAPIDIHSKKPNIVRKKIEELCKDGSKIELFATEKTGNWDVIGYRANGKDVKQALINMSK